MGEHPDLSPDIAEQIALRVVELLKQEINGEGQRRYVDAATIADDLEVERDWVYAHAKELGGIRLGGPKGRLRFDRHGLLDAPGIHRLSASSLAAGSPGFRKQAALAKRLRRKVESPQMQRRASGWTPARSPKQHQPGGSPDDEA